MHEGVYVNLLMILLRKYSVMALWNDLWKISYAAMFTEEALKFPLTRHEDLERNLLLNSLVLLFHFISATQTLLQSITPSHSRIRCLAVCSFLRYLCDMRLITLNSCGATLIISSRPYVFFQSRFYPATSENTCT